MQIKDIAFTRLLLQENDLDPGGFSRWLFWPGMLFKARDKWWGDLGRRDFPHEGVDFCLYRDREGQIHRLAPHTRVPVMLDGIVRAVFKDYLGQAVIVEHEGHRTGGASFLSVYAHTQPYDGIRPGAIVSQGAPIGTIADTRRAKARILPHLHLTLGRPFPELVYDSFVWNVMRDSEKVALQDPAKVINWPYEVVDPHNQEAHRPDSGGERGRPAEQGA